MTKKQKAVYEFLKKYFVENQRVPTVREIMNHFGFKSPRTVSQYLDYLEECNCIRRSIGARNIRIVGAKISFIEVK